MIIILWRDNYTMNKEVKIFISHSTKDKKYAEALVKFLKELGVSSKFIFCSSVPPHDVEITKNFLEEILEQFQKYDLKMIYLLSENYYASPVSLNEMGAAWVSRFEYFSILLYGFDFPQMKGVIDPKAIALKLDEDRKTAQAKLDGFKGWLSHTYELNELDDWEQVRDTFIDALEKIKMEGKRRSAIIMPSPI